MRRTRARGSPRSSTSRLKASKGDAVMTPPKSKMTCVYLDMARLERRLTLTSIGPRSPLFKARAPGTAPTRPLWDDDDPLLRVGLSREHFPLGRERRVAAATFHDPQQLGRESCRGQ